MRIRSWIIWYGSIYTENIRGDMKQKLFLDTNVVLDTMVHGRESSAFSSLILGFDSIFDLCISVQSFPDIVYITRNEFDTATNRRKFKIFLEHCSILTLNDSNLSEAVSSVCPNFEDALQISCAAESNCDAIITSNKKHFDAYTDIPVYTPKEFLDKLQAAQEC